MVKAPCDECGVTVLEDQGDPWAFVIIFDRVFVLALIAIVYFRLGPPTTWGLVAVFTAIIGLFVYTTPHRFGFCVGLVHAIAGRRWLGSSSGPSDVSPR